MIYPKKAIVSLCLGILNVILTLWGIFGNLLNFIVVASILGLTLGVLSLRDIKGTKKLKGKKIAIWGIVLNSLTIILIIFAFIALGLFLQGY